MLAESSWEVILLLLLLASLGVYAVMVRLKLWFLERSIRALRDLLRD